MCDIIPASKEILETRFDLRIRLSCIAQPPKPNTPERLFLYREQIINDFGKSDRSNSNAGGFTPRPAGRAGDERMTRASLEHCADPKGRVSEKWIRFSALNNALI
jgi:hypothetical protein